MRRFIAVLSLLLTAAVPMAVPIVRGHKPILRLAETVLQSLTTGNIPFSSVRALGSFLSMLVVSVLCGCSAWSPVVSMNARDTTMVAVCEGSEYAGD